MAETSEFLYNGVVIAQSV